MPMNKFVNPLSLFLLLAGVGDAIQAQTNLETNAGIQFNFSTPGARSLGLGGAFLALADDATAAYSNPAGLTNVIEREFSTEARLWEYTHVFTDRGRIEGREPIGREPDTIAGLVDGQAVDTVAGLSFLSVVIPKKRWSVAFYRHELANFEANFSAQGAFLELTRSRSVLGFPGEIDGRLASLENEMSLRVINHGVSVGYKLHPSLSLGVGVSFYDFSLDSVASRFLPPLVETSNFRREQVTSIQTQSGEGSDWGFSAGFLWQGKIWTLGGVFRQGPGFALDVSNRSGPGSQVEFSASPKQARFNVPDVYGLGISFKPSDEIRLSLEYDRVFYSQLADGIVDIFSITEFFPARDPELDGFVIDDADELRLGFEYSILSQRLALPISFRLGLWHDPDHSLRFEGENLGLRAIYRPKEDQFHYSAGIGCSFKTFQLDAALDYSDRASTASLSTVWRF